MPLAIYFGDVKVERYVSKFNYSFSCLRLCWLSELHQAGHNNAKNKNKTKYKTKQNKKYTGNPSLNGSRPNDPEFSLPNPAS